MKNLKAKVVAGLGVGALAVGGFMAVAPATASAGTACNAGSYTIGIGGLGDNTSGQFAGIVDMRIGYNSTDIQGGANAIQAAVTNHRNQCPGQHIHLTGYSGGAAAMHVWVSQSGRNLPNANVTLIADPKRPAGYDGLGGANGFAVEAPWVWSAPLGGADANFGNMPVQEICNVGWDHICDSSASWIGYLFQGAHQAYPFGVAGNNS